MEAKARVLDESERVDLSRALAQTGGNVSDAARRLRQGAARVRQAAQEDSIDKRMFP